ncbi:MAG: hypothetical protein ACRYFZ_19095 [Janthinobacterium lividum]
MQFTSFLIWLLVVARVATATTGPAVDLVAATTQQLVTVSARSNGLGPSNLRCTLTNQTAKELRVRVPPGLHFAADEEKAQDIFTFQEQLLVLAPGASGTVLLWALCMEQHDHSPAFDSEYTFRGMAGRGLQPLGDSLQKYPLLSEDYGQMFVWALTDHGQLHEVSVPAKLRRAATNVLRYLSSVTGQPAPKVIVSTDGRASIRTFSKQVFLVYHNPTAQVGAVKVYGANGRLLYEVLHNWKISAGVVRYQLGVNAIVGIKEVPTFTVRLLSATGQVLKELNVTDATSELDTPPTRQDFTFAFTLAKPVRDARMRVRLPDGTLVEELKQMPYLPAGHFNYKWAFYHLQPVGTPFVVRLETAGGTLLSEQALATAPH